MNKLLIASRIMRVEGILLLLVAAIHLAVIPTLRSVFVRLLSPGDFQFVWSPFLLNHAVVGILLIPLSLSTLYCATGIRRGEGWSWRVGMTNPITILTLPLVLVAVMERRYFSALPFLIAAILITVVGLSMIWPLLWVRRELR
ncbi:MAG: hypothetical protein WAQ52_04955 [Terriglobales bacterium]